VAYLLGIELSLHEAELAFSFCLAQDWIYLREYCRNTKGDEAAVLLLGRSLDIQIHYYLVRMSLKLHLVMLDVFEDRLVQV
jgi:hypothetical protein